MNHLFDWMNGFFPLMEKGGWVMWPIAGCSVISLTIILERTWFLVIRSNRIVPEKFLKELASLLEKGKIEEAVIACRKDDSIIARVLLSGLSILGSPRSTIREMMEDSGRRECRVLDRSLGILAAMAGVSPLLGLFGTVLGMIRIFEEIARQNLGNFESLASGIFVALYTTAAGLAVAIPSYLAYRALVGLSDRYVRDMEEWSVDLLNILERHANGNGKSNGNTPQAHP